jgi:hypothetical protein
VDLLVSVVLAASVVLDPLVQLALADLEALPARLEALQASAVLAALVDPLVLEEKLVPLANLEDPEMSMALQVLEVPRVARQGSAVSVASEDLEVLLAVSVAPLV